MKFFLNFYKLLNFIYRKNCLICFNKRENSFLCEECKDKISFNNPILIKTIDDIKIYSCCNYSGIPRDLIKILKFHKKKEAAKIISDLIFEVIKNNDLDFSDFELICVPLYKKKQHSRGFNQCELITEELSKMLNLPYNFKLIKRVKNTLPMYNLNYQERRENMKDAFLVNKKYYSGKKILIIDDIVTTGSTLESMISTLKQNEINEICCLTFTNTEKTNISAL